MTVPETTSAEAFAQYVGGECLRASRGKAWRAIKAWIIDLPRSVDTLPLPSVSDRFTLVLRFACPCPNQKFGRSRLFSHDSGARPIPRAAVPEKTIEMQSDELIQRDNLYEVHPAKTCGL